MMSKIDSTPQNKSTIEIILNHVQPFIRYARLSELHLIPISELAELLKDHSINGFDSARQVDSKCTKIVVLCLPVQKLYKFL